MKLEKPVDGIPKANFFEDVSQDVSQLNNTVIHRLWIIEPSPICLKRIICPLCFHGRYRAYDPGRGLPRISYFQADTLAAEKIRPTAAFICALFSEVFEGLIGELYREVSKGSYQSGAYAVHENKGLAK